MNSSSAASNRDGLKELALKLLRANSEQEVISILRDASLWEDSDKWRLVGDDENNFRTIGSQQARPDPALVEKLINSVDARLMDECIRLGLDPKSPEAPQTINQARNLFFASQDRVELSKGITLSVTGSRAQQEGMPCITICDIGEGQTPVEIPETFMSIDRKNKLRIPFVQGKFNMGGTGALMFCGRHKLQLLITRRDPETIPDDRSPNENDSHWGITVVRRESPPEGPGQVRNPYFKYLAPVGADSHPGMGGVFSFEASELHLMPDGRNPYSRPMSWGTCLKLYEYDMRGFKGHALRTGGLLARLEILLPEIALPVRVHECREGLRGHAGSFDTSLLGLRDRLESSRSDNLEPGYPNSLPLNPHGEPMVAKIYAFKGDNADRYRADQGVVFTVNGQTHGWFPKSFFERNKVKMGRLAKSLLVVVDCSEISVEARADLFKNSRDRLSGGDLRREIEEELEFQIANHPGLRELRERRRREEVENRLSEAKPLEDVLRAIIKTSPSLTQLFNLGPRLNTPFKTDGEGTQGGPSGGNNQGTGEFHGKKHPTFFRFWKLHDGEPLERTSEIGRRCQLRLATDVENEYFVRDDCRGRYHVEAIEGPLEGRELTTSINLYNGAVNWSVAIPKEEVSPGDRLTIQLTVEDDVLLEPMVNISRILLTEKSEAQGGGGSRNQYSGGNSNGTGDGGNKDGDRTRGDGTGSSGIQLPEIVTVHQNEWSRYGFDERSACTVIEDGDVTDGEESSSFTFYVNVDNLFLKTDMKRGSHDPALVQAKFVYGNVLTGLALIHDDQVSRNRSETNADHEEEEGETIANKIENVSRALSPFLVPMVDYLGGLEQEAVAHLAQTGDEE